MKKLNKIWPLVAILPFCCVSSAFADYNTKNTTTTTTRETQVCETKKVRVRPVISPAYLAEARPHLVQDANVFISGEFLWWTSNLDGTHYAMSGIGTDSSESVHKEKTKWSPGFRVGLGYNFMHDGWDLDLKYTWFRQSRTGHHHNNNDGSTSAAGLYSTRANPDGLTALTSARVQETKHHHGLFYNTLDLEMGRWSWMGKKLAVRPFAGVRGGWIRKDLNIDYYAGAEHQSIKNQQKTAAVGPRAGMNTGWYFDDNWSIFGDAACNLVWTRSKVTYRSGFDGGATGTPMNPHENIQALRNVFDMGLGIRWDNYFKDDSYHLGIQVGWENHSWSNFNQLFYFIGDTTGTNPASFVQNQGDLSMYGVNVGVCFDF